MSSANTTWLWQPVPADKPLDPSVIDTAPLSLISGADEVVPDERDRQISRLRHETEKLHDDLEKAKNEMTVATQKAKLLIPYANKVFWFCVWFSIISAGIIILHGATKIEFELPDMVLSLVAGSTLASVIGLLMAIVTGIFKSK